MAEPSNLPIEECECSCSRCAGACKRNPGWMVPSEAQAAMDAGLHDRLMLDWLESCKEVGNDDRIYVITPASQNCEGDYAPEFSFMDIMLGFVTGKGQCTFLENDLCSIHTSGFKPTQCRFGSMCGKPFFSNFDMAVHWDTQEGRDAVARWAELNDQVVYYELP